MLKNSTVIKESSKKLELMADMGTRTKTVMLSSIDSLNVFQEVTVNIKSPWAG